MSGNHDPYKLSRAWEEFVSELTAGLQLLEEDEYLILSSKTSGRFVQFAHQGKYGLRMEAVGNHYLKGDQRLSHQMITELMELGWCEPSHTALDEQGPGRDPDGSPNYYVDWDSPVSLKRAAALAVATLARAFRIPHPGKLTYQCASFTGQSIRLPNLPLAREPYRPKRSDPDLQCVVRPSMERLSEVVAQVIAELTHQEIVEYDCFGTLPIQVGEMDLWVRPVEEPRHVAIVCLIAGELQNVVAAEEALNKLNENLLVGRVYRCREADAVLYSLEFVAEPFVRASFKQALRLAGTQAKQVREHWQNEVAR